MKVEDDVLKKNTGWGDYSKIMLFFDLMANNELTHTFLL